MHYLVVAKVEDYPDVCDLIKALSHGYSFDTGKWGVIADSFEDFLKTNKDDIISDIDDEEMSIEDQTLAYMELFGYLISFDGQIYEKVSSHFDSCVLGGRYTKGDLEYVAPYQNVIDEHGGVGAFVLPDYDFYYTEYKKCPFKPDDLVYVLDGHN